LIGGEISLLIIHPNKKQKPAAIISINARMMLNIKLKREVSSSSGISSSVGNMVNCMATPHSIHAIPRLITTMKTILAQFLLFKRPIADAKVVAETTRKPKKKRRTLRVLLLVANLGL
jgi:hypothetical protein